MADLSNGSTVFQTYTNAGVGVAELGDNKAAKAGQGIAGRTLVISFTTGGAINQTQLDGFLQGISYGETNGSPAKTDAFTVVGVAGTVASGTMYLALQGTGTLQTTKGDYFTATTVASVADFPGISG